jgi:integrase
VRVSEALGLEWPDVEFGARPRVRVRRQFYRGTLKRLKSSNGRRDLPLSQALARKLWTARPADGEGPVFATRNATRLSDRNVRRVLDKAAAERAGLEWASFHTFRHTCASLLFDSGRNIRQVCDWLGHADPAFALRSYVHLIDGGLGEPLELAVEPRSPRPSLRPPRRGRQESSYPSSRSRAPMTSCATSCSSSDNRSRHLPGVAARWSFPGPRPPSGTVANAC